MAKQTVSRTALGAAICRMIEQYQPEKIRLFDDPVAKELVGSTITLVSANIKRGKRFLGCFLLFARGALWVNEQ